MSSTITGNVGAANSGAIISAVQIDQRVSNGIIGAVAPGAVLAGGFSTSAVASGAGAFTLGGLPVGTYVLKASLTVGVLNTDPTPIVLTQSLITVDGSSTYTI